MAIGKESLQRAAGNTAPVKEAPAAKAAAPAKKTAAKAAHTKAKTSVLAKPAKGVIPGTLKYDRSPEEIGVNHAVQSNLICDLPIYLL